MKHLTALMADIVASIERTEAEDARAAAKAKAYNGPWRRKTDAVDVQARVVEDASALPAPPEAEHP